MCVCCVRVCLWKREKERERVCVCERESVCEREFFCVYVQAGIAGVNKPSVSTTYLHDCTILVDTDLACIITYYLHNLPFTRPTTFTDIAPVRKSTYLHDLPLFQTQP